MKLCRHTGFECTQPHIKCGACETHWWATRDQENQPGLTAARKSVPRVRTYVRLVAPTGNIGIEIGIKGTF